MLRRTAGVLVCLGLMAGCHKGEGQAEPLRVFAAASLRGCLGPLKAPVGPVEFNFAGSQELRAQLENGAEADVVALADQATMTALVTSGLVEAPSVFVRNELVVVVPAASLLRSFEELPSAERIVLGVADVPVGRYADQVLDAAEVRAPGFRARLLARVVSREPNVNLVMTKVLLGEADAAFVYRSDAVEAGAKVRVVELPPELSVVGVYPMAVLKAAKHRAAAQDFVRWALSPEAQASFTRAGFRSAQALK